MLTVAILLVFGALMLTLISAAGQCPIEIPVFLLGIVVLYHLVWQ